MKRFLNLFMVTMLSAACGTESAKTTANITPPITQNAKTQGTPIPGAPDWVSRGAHFRQQADARFFIGVGSAPVMGDIAMQKASADDQARAELARIFLFMMDILARDYLALAQSEQIALDERLTLSQIKDAGLNILQSTRIAGSWRENKTQTIWVNAELDLVLVKTRFAEIDVLDERFKKYFDASAHVVFERLASQNGATPN